MIEIFGIIGYPIKHSLSPAMHNSAFRELSYPGIYLPFEVEKRDLKDAIMGVKALGIKGINVTIPYKEEVVKYFKCDKAVEEIGACNTVDVLKEKCYNTDVYGILKALENAGINIRGLRVLIIGAGGAGKACIYALRDENDVFLTNRTSEKGVNVAKKFGVEFVEMSKLENFNFDLIVNATPLGMKGFPEKLPVPEKLLKSKPAVFDMVYNPPETPLIKRAKEHGCLTMNGVDMLVYQGAKAFEIFTGLKAPVDVMKKAVVSELEKLI